MCESDVLIIAVEFKCVASSTRISVRIGEKLHNPRCKI
jgi:hypothetical protein